MVETVTVDRFASRATALLLTFNGGFVDTAGFLALGGLFTAHVTGNFVTIGAALVFGSAGVLTKLAALPVFCVSVLLCRWLTWRWERRHVAALPRLLSLYIVALGVGCGVAAAVLPKAAIDSAPSMAAGLLLVAAMGIQNGLHRTHLAATPPSTLMTGTTTQIMVDIADLLAGRAAPQVGARVRGMTVQVGVFAIGCGLAALAYGLASARCFLLPPLVAIMIVVWPLRARKS